MVSHSTAAVRRRECLLSRCLSKRKGKCIARRDAGEAEAENQMTENNSSLYLRARARGENALFRCRMCVALFFRRCLRSAHSLTAGCFRALRLHGRAPLPFLCASACFFLVILDKALERTPRSGMLNRMRLYGVWRRASFGPHFRPGAAREV